jgi:hypothetical protein
MFRQTDTVTDAAPDRFGEFLKGCRAMNVEQLDGFFAALIAGRQTEMLAATAPGGTGKRTQPR